MKEPLRCFTGSLNSGSAAVHLCSSIGIPVTTSQESAKANSASSYESISETLSNAIWTDLEYVPKISSKTTVGISSDSSPPRACPAGAKEIINNTNMATLTCHFGKPENIAVRLCC